MSKKRESHPTFESGMARAVPSRHIPTPLIQSLGDLAVLLFSQHPKKLDSQTLNTGDAVRPTGDDWLTSNVVKWQSPRQVCRSQSNT